MRGWRKLALKMAYRVISVHCVTSGPVWRSLALKTLMCPLCQFLFIAKSSAAELQSHAYVALDQKFISEPEFKSLYAEIDHECRMLSNLIKHLSRTH